MAITDFDLWLDSVDLSDFNDVYALYHSVSGIEDWGSFKTERGRICGLHFPDPHRQRQAAGL